MIAGMVHTVPFRVIAMLLAAVLMVVVGAPAKAEAMDALTIIANVEGDKVANEGRVVWVACADADGCVSIPAETAAAMMSPVVDKADRQGP